MALCVSLDDCSPRRSFTWGESSQESRADSCTRIVGVSLGTDLGLFVKRGGE